MTSDGYWIRCDLEPEDTGRVEAVETTLGNACAISLTEAGRGTLALVLVPERARAFAAAILNEADRADGTVPLVFHPATPDAPEPA